MASIKISGLTEQTTASDTDLLPVASSAGMAKRMTLANFVTWLASKLNSKFAPAGYGLGESNGKLVTDPDTVLAVGFYILGGLSTTNLPSGFRYGVMLVEKRDSCIYQTFKSANGFSTLLEARRYSIDNGATWSGLEYANPPMELGVEYRTTERWNGQPVYVKLVDCGQGPATGAKNLFPSAGTNIVYTNLACKARNTSEGFCIMLDNYLSAFEYPAGNNTVALNYTKDLSNYNIYLTVKYYKA